jgi:hypothetical protein
MNELTLHIGLPKTGTSTLQHYLSANSEELKNQGICYPKTGRNYVGHHQIAEACRQALPFGRELREIRSALDSEVAGFDRVILSSEAFQSLRGCAGVIILFGLPSGRHWATSPASSLFAMRPRHLRTICYLREFLDFASSTYSQKVQSSSICMSFEEYCGVQFRRPLRYLTSYWSWFSDEIQFGLFERNRLRNQNIVDDFFGRIGAAMPSPETSRDANPSISGNLLTFKLLLNSYHLHSRKHYRTFSELAREDPAFRGRFRILDADAEALRQRSSRYNDEVRRLVGDIPYKSFEHEKPVYDPTAWTQDVERFLSHPALAHLKDHPEIARAAADTSIVTALQRKLDL